jgi:hypothetical protein
MWKITTRGFTLHEVLVMAARNVASALIATDKSERTTAPPRAPRFNRLRRNVMAKVIEFYIPKDFRKALRTAAQPRFGKIIEFCPQSKRSA